jgi:hypothetical protein
VKIDFRQETVAYKYDLVLGHGGHVDIRIGLVRAASDLSLYSSAGLRVCVVYSVVSALGTVVPNRVTWEMLY